MLSRLCDLPSPSGDGEGLLAAALTTAEPAVCAEVLNGLARSTWQPDAKTVIDTMLRERLLELVRDFARGPGLSDVSRQQVEDIRNVVHVLDALDALPLVKAEVQAIVDQARGELWDDYTRNDFAKRLSGK